jgi:hypothetical protein
VGELQENIALALTKICSGFFCPHPCPRVWHSESNGTRLRDQQSSSIASDELRRGRRVKTYLYETSLVSTSTPGFQPAWSTNVLSPMADPTRANDRSDRVGNAVPVT